MSGRKALQLLLRSIGQGPYLLGVCHAATVEPAVIGAVHQQQHRLWTSSIVHHTSPHQAPACGFLQGDCSKNHLSYYSTSATDAAETSSQHKRQALKCNTTPAGTAVSQAVACMVDRDLMPREQLCSKMEQLSQQMVREAAAHSSTEMSAFVEACRKMDYQHKLAFTAIIQHLAPHAASIAADELPSLLWAASTLAAEGTWQEQEHHAAAATTTSNSSSTHSSTDDTSGSNSSSGSSSSSSSRAQLPQNDGVIGAVSSSKIADLPHVVEFMLGASQVLSGDLDALDCQELPVVAAALTDLEYRDPFLLTVLAGCVIERKQELSEGELLALIRSFAAMGRWFFDNRLIDSLTAELVQRARTGAVQQESVTRVATCLASIHHKNKVLLQYLDERGSSQGGL